MVKDQKCSGLMTVVLSGLTVIRRVSLKESVE